MFRQIACGVCTMALLSDDAVAPLASTSSHDRATKNPRSLDNHRLAAFKLRVTALGERHEPLAEIRAARAQLHCEGLADELLFQRLRIAGVEQRLGETAGDGGPVGQRVGRLV